MAEEQEKVNFDFGGMSPDAARRAFASLGRPNRPGDDWRVRRSAGIAVEQNVTVAEPNEVAESSVGVSDVQR